MRRCNFLRACVEHYNLVLPVFICCCHCHFCFDFFSSSFRLTHFHFLYMMLKFVDEEFFFWLPSQAFVFMCVRESFFFFSLPNAMSIQRIGELCLRLCYCFMQPGCILRSVQDTFWLASIGKCIAAERYLCIHRQ